MTQANAHPFDAAPIHRVWDARRLAVYFTAAWSGFFVMAVELLGGRLLAPNFGGGIYVWGGLITTFMLSLAVGYVAGGHLSTRRPRLHDLSYLLFGASLTILPVTLIGEPFMDWVFEHVHDVRYGSLIAAMVMFLVPTAISGAVSPVAIQLLTRGVHSSGKSAGLTYFVSTFGSAAGTILTSFYLVMLFDVNNIIIGMSLMSILLGLFLLVLSRKT